MHGDVLCLIYSYVLIVLIKSIILQGRYLLDFFFCGGGCVLIFVNNHIGDRSKILFIILKLTSHTLEFELLVQLQVD